jgi:mannose-1-phosphate guanylyltransferase
VEKDSTRVKTFHEKPDIDTAVSYVKNGNFFWNAGIFIAAVGTWTRLMQEHLPGLYARIQEGQDAYLADYPNYPNTSIGVHIVLGNRFTAKINEMKAAVKTGDTYGSKAVLFGGCSILH